MDAIVSSIKQAINELIYKKACSMTSITIKNVTITYCNLYEFKPNTMSIQVGGLVDYYFDFYNTNQFVKVEYKDLYLIINYKDLITIPSDADELFHMELLYNPEELEVMEIINSLFNKVGYNYDE